MLLSVYGYVVTITSVSLYIGARKGRVSSARVLESPGEVIGYTFASLEDTFSNGNLPPTGIRLPLNQLLSERQFVRGYKPKYKLFLSLSLSFSFFFQLYLASSHSLSIPFPPFPPGVSQAFTQSLNRDRGERSLPRKRIQVTSPIQLLGTCCSTRGIPLCCEHTQVPFL